MPSCPECGRILPAAGFCPHCLLKGGLEMPEVETSAFQAVQAAPEIATEGLESSLMGRYQLGAKLGEGGFGFVFEATQTQPIRREVAVKVLKAGMNAAQVIARFEMERQALALMNHPGIARVLDAGETQDGRPFFVMERVHGVPVTQFVREQNPPLIARLHLFMEICDAVHHAHTKGVIHRDLKPSNILVTVADGNPHVKVIDFGLAKALDTRLTRRTIYTLHDQIIGTPGYISPEQVEHGAEVADVRGDVYALGALLYEMLTDVAVVDQKSLAGKSLHEALREATTRRLIPPSQHKPRLRGDLECIILKTLAPEPDRRYASADALAQDILRYLNDQPVLAHPASPRYTLGKFAKRHRRAAVVALGFLLAIFAAAGAGILHFMQQHHEQQMVEAHHEEILRGQSWKDFQTARLISEHGRHSDTIAFLCSSLRANPENEIASTYLCSLMAQSAIGLRLAGDLRVEQGWDALVGIAASSARRRIAAVFQSSKQDRPDLIARWDVSGTWRPQKLILPSGPRVSIAIASPDDEFLLLGFNDGSLARYDLHDGGFVPFAEKMTGDITAIAFAADSKFALAGTAKGEVRLWNVATQQPAAPAIALQGNITHLALSADAKHALALQQAALISLLPQTGKMAAPPWAMPQNGVTQIAMNPQGTLAAVGLSNGHVISHRVPDLQPMSAPLTLMGSVSTLHFNDNGTTLAAGDSHGYVNVWHMPEARITSVGTLLRGPVHSVRPLAARGLVLIIGAQGEIRLWHPTAGTRRGHQGHQQISHATSSRDGTLVVMAQAKGPTLEVWEQHPGVIVPQPCVKPPEKSAGLVASLSTPSGAPLTLIARDRTYRSDSTNRLEIKDAATGHLVCAPLFHDNLVCHAALTPDQTMLLTITVDGTHRVWDAHSGEPLQPPFKCGERASIVRVFAHGTSYAYKSEDGEWLELPFPVKPGVPPAWFLDFAEARATKRLLPNGSTEWVRHEKQNEIVTAHANDTGYPAILVRWLMAAPKERAPWPSSPAP